MKTNQLGVLYFADSVPLSALFEESGAIEGQAFLAAWKSLPPETQQRIPQTVYHVRGGMIRDGEGVIRYGEGVIRYGEGVIRYGEGVIRYSPLRPPIKP